MLNFAGNPIPVVIVWYRTCGYTFLATLNFAGNHIELGNCSKKTGNQQMNKALRDHNMNQVENLQDKTIA
jgi:hypothetical protein